MIASIVKTFSIFKKGQKINKREAKNKRKLNRVLLLQLLNCLKKSYLQTIIGLVGGVVDYVCRCFSHFFLKKSY